MHSYLSTLLLSLSVAAQVPVGNAVNGSIGGSSTPLLTLTPPPVTVNVVTGAAFANINCVAIDPMDGSIWMGTNAGGALRRGNISGSTFINDNLVATLPPTGLAAITFDINCNPVAGGGSLTSTGGVWIVDRNTGVFQAIVNSAAGLTGTVNALDTDSATGDVYFGVFGTGNVFRVSPPYALNSHVLIGTTSSVTTSISGVTFARNTANPNGVLYISAFAGNSNNSICSMNPTTGVVTFIPGTPQWYDANWVDHDRVNDVLWINSTFAARSLSLSTLAGNNTLLHQIPNGTPASIEVNDVNPATAETRVCPQFVPTPTSPITLELTVAGNPGELGVIAIVAPAVVVLGSGLIGADGLFRVAFPGLTVPAGNPASITFLSGTVNTNTLGVKLSPTVPWPRN